MRYTTVFLLLAGAPVVFAQIPEGFKPLFNTKDLQGWHISQVNHHGDTKAWKNENGVISVTQDRPGNGGILLTDGRYRDFEVSLEIKPDWGCDGGLFLRSSEKGEGYQVMIDYLQGGMVGGIYGERLKDVRADNSKAREWQKHWKKDEWNHLRARIEGETPRIQVWLNGVQIVDWTDTANHLADGATDGMIALQAHVSGEKSPRWAPGGFHRFRNVAVRELK
jgi:hypothetical protein